MNGLTLITVLTLLLAPQQAAQETRIDAGRPVGLGVILPQAGQQKPPPPPPPPPPPVEVKRRGSFVGYIDDAVVASKLRLRFEAGFENLVPDRVEFFYAKCGCYLDIPIEEFRDPESPGPSPGAATDLNFQQVYIQGEVALGNRVSLFGEFPLRWIQPQAFFPPSLDGGEGFSDQSGLSDIRVGVKAEVVSTPAQVVTLQLRGYLPTGESEKGLGTNHATLEPSLLMYHRIGDRASIESQVGLWYPLNGADGLPITAEDKFSAPVFYYGIGPSIDVYRSARVRFGPVVELVGWHLTGGFQSFPPDFQGFPPDDDAVDASGVNILNIKFGARVTWNDTDTIYGGWGRGLTDQKWYRDLIRVEYRRTF